MSNWFTLRWSDAGVVMLDQRKLPREELYVTLPGKSVGNGLRFDRDGSLFVADYPEHNVLRVDPKSKAVTVFAHQPKMNQPPLPVAVLTFRVL